MPKPAKPEADIPDVERHDEVYFRHASGPKCGRVLARGAHGCTVEADGKRHKVRWDGLLGHKTRVRPKAKVIDQGEDGFLVADPAGRRRFIRDPLGVIPGQEETVTKAAWPAVVFFGGGERTFAKAFSGGVKNRPGLSLQDVTDKTGKRTKRWKRTVVETKVPERHGDDVRESARRAGTEPTTWGRGTWSASVPAISLAKVRSWANPAGMEPTSKTRRAEFIG